MSNSEKKSISLSVFFPAYNEEENITDTVAHAEAALQAITDTYEIIIVNDGSKDKTGVIADSLAQNNKNIKVVHLIPNQGYGAAVWSGITAAQHEYVFFTDADLQFKLDELKLLVEHVPQHDVVIGYRAKRMDPLMRLANAKGWNMLNRALFGLKVKDIDCAFKLFKKEVVKDLPIQSRGAMLSAEMLIRLQRNGVTFKEVPVTHLPRTKGSPTGAKLSVIFRAFKEMLSVYQGDLGNKHLISVFKFGIVGVVNTLIDWCLYFILTRYTVFFALHLAIAKGVSFMGGTVPSFIANRYWTFNQSSPVKIAEITKFYLTVIVALAINAFSLYVFVHIFNMYDLVGVILATVLSFIWNYMISKFWVFKSDEEAAKDIAQEIA